MDSHTILVILGGIILVLVLLVLSWVVEKKAASKTTVLAPNLGEQPMPNPSDNPLLPVRWDEAQIRSATQRYEQQPTVLEHFINSLLERFVHNQNNQTAQLRIKFLQTMLQGSTLSKDLLVAGDNLALHAKERQIRVLKLDLEHADLKDRKTKEQELRDLQHETAVLKERLEQEKLRRQIKEEPETAPPEPTREERKQRLEPELRDIERKEDVNAAVNADGLPPHLQESTTVRL